MSLKALKVFLLRREEEVRVVKRSSANSSCFKFALRRSGHQLDFSMNDTFYYIKFYDCNEALVVRGFCFLLNTYMNGI